MNINQRVQLSPLSPTTLSQQMSSNFVKVDDQLNGIINLVEDDNQEQAVCCEAFKENVSVTYANLFEFNRHNSEVVIKESPSQAQGSIDIDCECDHILRQSSFDSDDLATSTCKTSKKRAVSFAPSCQVIHIDNEDNQAYLCHEAVKEGSSPQGCIGGEIGRILGLKKRRSVSQDQGSCDGVDVGIYKTDKKQVVSFAPSCPTIHLVDNQTEGIEDELWYSQHDFMHFEDEACLCSQMIRDSESQGTFDGELGHILGLEKIILCDSYLDRRDALRQTVLNEQAVQQLVKDLRSRQGCESDDESNAEEISLLHLAATSERLSLWARERASMAAFTLEHNLATCEAQEGSSSR